MAMKLQDKFKYKSLAVRRQYHTAYEQKQPKNIYPLVEPSALLGIEIEVENISYPPALSYYWHADKDGSLRNCGVEFISIPMRAKQIEPALNYLASKIVQDNEPSFSNRTSVHVHMNVRDFSWEQVRSLVVLYAIFEKHFFHLVGTRRENSIFCVPLYKTEQLKALNLLDCNPKWHKYNALNLACIAGDEDVKGYGTIEFRHLYGTLDPKVIINWVNNICCLRRFAMVTPYEEILAKLKTLNTTSEYIGLYQQVFGEYADLRTMYKQDFEECITLTKAALWGHTLYEKYAFARGSAYDKYQKPQAKTKPKSMKDIWNEIHDKELNVTTAVHFNPVKWTDKMLIAAAETAVPFSPDDVIFIGEL